MDIGGAKIYIVMMVVMSVSVMIMLAAQQLCANQIDDQADDTDEDGFVVMNRPGRQQPRH